MNLTKKLNRVLFTTALIGFTVSASEMIEKDFSAEFGKFTGTIVVYDLNSDKYTIYNKARAETRYSPCSTFKIPNSIIALETGIITDVDKPFQWDTLKYPPQDWWFAHWNEKNSMRSAIKYSVVPFYRTIASLVGLERMKSYVDKFNYGNKDISSGLDSFWLSGSLNISAMEEVEFLKKFYCKKLGISEKTTDAVKSILVQEKTESYTLSGKTGGGNQKNNPEKGFGWLVGYVEKGKNVYFFALNIDAESFSEMLKPRIDITKAVLKKMGII